jgi:hypothetical protein
VPQALQYAFQLTVEILQLLWCMRLQCRCLQLGQQGQQLGLQGSGLSQRGSTAGRGWGRRWLASGEEPLQWLQRMKVRKSYHQIQRIILCVFVNEQLDVMTWDKRRPKAVTELAATFY